MNTVHVVLRATFASSYLRIRQGLNVTVFPAEGPLEPTLKPLRNSGFRHVVTDPKENLQFALNQRLPSPIEEALLAATEERNALETIRCLPASCAFIEPASSHAWQSNNLSRSPLSVQATQNQCLESVRRLRFFRALPASMVCSETGFPSASDLSSVRALYVPIRSST